MYEPVIGLEIHVELSTKSKMFCQCDAAWQKYKSNENTCPVCLGLPGALPVPNREAVQRTIKIAQALGCSINRTSHFDRKHYFYPDLPKGYQISQYDEPIGVKGALSVRIRDEHNQFVRKEFRITRVHLEEDTGKLSHSGADTVVDFNRSSVPLVEIVTEPDFRSSDDVKAFLQELHTIITYLDVSEADMEKGSMRLEPNISVRHVAGSAGLSGEIKAEDLPKYKVEVKNINSFNFVKKAIDYEVVRQSELLEKGEMPAQETRGWDEKKSATYSQRSKEFAHDYRYFPEPDIPPMTFDEKLLAGIQSTIPELPAAKVERYVTEYGMKEVDAVTITRGFSTTHYFESIIKKLQDTAKAGQVATLIVNKKIDISLSPDEFIEKLTDLTKPKTTDMNTLSAAISSVLSANAKSVLDYKAGKTNAVMFLVGQVMRQMKGQADAQVVKTEIETALRSHA